jgi:hypothetical protein
MIRTRRFGVRLAVVLTLLLPLLAGARPAQAATFTPLALAPGWTGAGAPYRAAAVANDSGIIRLRGVITRPSGSGNDVFTLPTAFRPAKQVYVPVTLCSSHVGALVIETNGHTRVDVPTGLTNAYCQTSLDGVSFAKTSTSFASIPLEHGWAKYPAANLRTVAARTINGIVYLQGVITTKGTDPDPFTMPAAFRPSRRVYVPVTLCSGEKGRLIIEPDGRVTVDAQHTFSFAACLTSLEGVSYAKTAANFTTLSLLSGWQHAPYSTRSVAVRVINGIVHFQGAAAAPDGQKPYTMFNLAPSLRPPAEARVYVDVCNANNGTLRLKTDGSTFSLSETDLADARCFTSLEGASYSL